MVIFLIGFRATGKTTVGRLLSARLKCHWVDTDSEIEKFSQRTIPEIFADDGEDGFRRIEQKVASLVVGGILRTEDAVVSLGGGAVLSDATRKLIGKRGVSVWLTAPAECLTQRILLGQSTTPRPALTHESMSDEVARLLAERQAVYSDCADYTIDTSELDVEQAVEEIALWWSSVDKTRSR